MNKRKFTPPTEFPAEYVNGFGDKITLRCKGIGEYPYVGQDGNGNWQDYRADGSFYVDPSKNDLHDIPQKRVHWMNDYLYRATTGWWQSREKADRTAHSNRIAVIRREWVQGELPQYFVEEV